MRQEAQPGSSLQNVVHALSDEPYKIDRDAIRAETSQVPSCTDTGLPFISSIPFSTPLGMSIADVPIGHTMVDLGPDSSSYRVSAMTLNFKGLKSIPLSIMQ